MNRQEILHALIDLFAYKAGYQTESSGLRLQEMQLLERVGAAEGLHTLELARRCGLAPATTVAILDRLQAAGYVQRVRDENDRRVVRVSLTGEGRRLLARHVAEDRAFVDNLLACLPPEDSLRLEHLLARLLAACSPETLFDGIAPDPPHPAAAVDDARERDD